MPQEAYPHQHGYCPSCRKVTLWIMESRARDYVTNFFCEPCGRFEDYYWDSGISREGQAEAVNKFLRSVHRGEYAHTA